MYKRQVLKETGITATAGIGTNLYLCKVAMDIVAKRVEADKDGVRIAELDEQSYRELLWTHEPLTDFWRVGPGYQKKLWQAGLRTMGDIAPVSYTHLQPRISDRLPASGQVWQGNPRQPDDSRKSLSRTDRGGSGR